MIAESPLPSRQDSIRNTLGKIEAELKRVATMMRTQHTATDENASHTAAWPAVNKANGSDQLARKWHGQIQKASLGPPHGTDAVSRRFQGLLSTVLESAK